MVHIIDSPVTLLGAEQIQRHIEDMADAVVQRWSGESTIAFVGVHNRGVPLAQRMAAAVQARGKTVDFGKIDITFYRDDLKTLPVVTAMAGSELGFDVDDSIIILCDEVIYTGRTTRAALEELLDFGRPRCVQFAVLVDRSGRELPLQPDYAGIQVTVAPELRVRVHFTETDGVDEVFTSPRDPS
jgi:pyrimidine operon attenuation protein / uracil phosphoribosyltransferase